MSTNATLGTRLADAEPYKGDDWAQWLARYMATPLFVMGVMAVFASLGTGVAGGVNVGRLFQAFTHPDLANLGRSEVLAQWTGAVAFLGMGLVLGGIVFHLVNIVRTLRDAGRDVQESLDAKPLKLRKPWTGHATPHVMLMGVMAEIAAFVVGVVAAAKIGGVNPAGIANASQARPSNLADIGVARAASMWLPGLRFAGIALLLSSVVLVLFTIQKTLRFQAARVVEIAELSSGPAPVIDLTTPKPAQSAPSGRPLVATSHSRAEARGYTRTNGRTTGRTKSRAS